MLQKEIHLMHIYGKDSAISTNTPNYKSHKINISHVFHSQQCILVSLNGPVAELL